MALPTEILLPIFTEASTIGLRADIASKNLCFSDIDGHSPLPDPLNIAAVCRRWREIALDAPQLWSSLSLSLDSDRLSDPSTPARLQLYVERSRGSPMTIRIHGQYTSNSRHTLAKVNPLMMVLRSCVHHWAELQLVSPPPRSLWNDTSLPIFQLLDGTVSYPDSSTRPSLQTLTLGEPLHLSNKPYSFTNHLFGRLTTLTVSPRLNLHHLWYGGILSRCSPTLTNLTIELLGVPDEGDFHRWQVLPSLRSLTIVAKWRKGNPKEAFASIFNALVCPGLKKLELRVETEVPVVTKRGQWPGPEAKEFLGIVEPPTESDPEEHGETLHGLEELILVNVKVAALELADILEATPSLRTLTFDGQVKVLRMH
ncbi:hypothetical protein PQX77_001540 [Marasmius sp. AFHP31]|nr:hypothetical protein PQX77_001540 [Marasmius sp. AFHP31]